MTRDMKGPLYRDFQNTVTVPFREKINKMGHDRGMENNECHRKSQMFSYLHSHYIEGKCH